MRISDWSSDVCSSDLPSQVDAAVERIRPLTQGAGLTGQRDFNVEVVNSSTIVITPTKAGIDNAVKSTMEVATEVIRKRIDEMGRSEERRVGKEWVSTCRSRW